MNISMISVRKSSRLAVMATLVAGAMLIAGTSLAAEPATTASSMTMTQSATMQMTNRYGGPVYNGAPALAVTVALVKAGGGPEHFSLVTALNSMLGEKTVKAEVAKLTKQYGQERVQKWVEVTNFYIADTLKIVTAKNIKLPPHADLSGTQLAGALVKAGTAPDGTFWAGYLFDHAVSHAIHNQLMDDADAKFGPKWDANAHQVTNQAFYDVAQALGMKNVKLSSYH